MQIGKIGFAIIGPTVSGRLIGARAPANLAVEFPRASSMGAHMDSPLKTTHPHARSFALQRLQRHDRSNNGVGRVKTGSP
jgi:hypothetical protein